MINSLINFFTSSEIRLYNKLKKFLREIRNTLMYTFGVLLREREENEERNSLTADIIGIYFPEDVIANIMIVLSFFPALSIFLFYK